MLKTTTKGKELTTWWQWACGLQTFWCPGADSVDGPVTSTSTHQRTVHELSKYPAMAAPTTPPCLYLGFAQTLLGVWDFLEHWPCHKPLSANSDVLVCLASLCVRYVNFCLVTILKSHCFTCIPGGKNADNYFWWAGIWFASSKTFLRVWELSGFIFLCVYESVGCLPKPWLRSVAMRQWAYECIN